MKKVSVIIPCFNVERTVSRCIESVTSQSIGLDNLDVIVINDCSDDNTMFILGEWQKMHKDIRVFSKEKRSLPGKIRNEALEMARGEYVAFVDADDWLDPQALEKAYEAAKDNDAEIVRYMFARANDDMSMQEEPDEPSRMFNFSTPFSEYDRIEFYQTAGMLRCCLDKLFKRSFINEHKLRFSEGVYDEESLFTVPAYLKAWRVYLLNECLYYYYDNKDGCNARMIGNAEHAHDNETVWMQVYQKAEEMGSLVTDPKLVEWFFVINYFYISRMLAASRGFPYSKQELKRMAGVVKKLFPDYLDNPVLKTRSYNLNDIEEAFNG